LTGAVRRRDDVPVRDSSEHFEGREVVHPETRAEWRRWLERNHARPEGVWLAAWKAATGKPRVEYEEVVEEALCFGWIDSKGKTLDAERSAIWMSPRKPRSGWSRSNKERVERLVRAGSMAPAGLAAIETAKQNGAWTALDGVEALEVPDDLARALARAPSARAHFDAFPPSARKMILGWIVSAKREETRRTRIEKTARLAARNIRAYP
jgi:uncharacterized protein YdeI (YjbR/CyaY-like superfamily)